MGGSCKSLMGMSFAKNSNSGRWGLNPRPSRWQRDALPLSYARRAGDEVRTRDIQLGKLTLYQLSYTRIRRHLGYPIVE